MLFLIAWRNLWRNRTRSLLILFSVMIGMWAGAFIVAIYYGMGNERLRIAIDYEVSHLQVHHPRFDDDKEVKYGFSPDSLQVLLSSQPQVKAFSQRSIGTGMMANASGSRGVQINGVNVDAEDATRSLKRFVKEGGYFDSTARNPVLISRKLAGQLNIRLNGKVVLTMLDTAEEIVSGAFRVCGIYETQNASKDALHVFVLKKDLDLLLGTSDRAHETAILLKKDEDLAATEAIMKKSFPDLKIRRWQEISPETNLIISSLDTYNVIFIVIILLALSFGIVNTMLMAVLERVREIGVLMAMGMSRPRLFGMVLLETVLLTVAGAPLGLLAAFATVEWVGRKGIDMTAIAGETMKDFGYGAVIFPELPLYSVIKILQLVLAASVLSSLYPAWKAIRLRPIEAIRG